MSQQEIRDVLSDSWKMMADQLLINPNRFFLTLTDGMNPSSTVAYPNLGIEEVIHVPALRGNPARTYPAPHVGETFSGTFDNYVASVILA